MLKRLFFVTLVILVTMAGVSFAALADDPDTFGLWHGDATSGGGGALSPDDTSLTGRTANDLTLKPSDNTVSGAVAVGITTGGQGVYGEALDFGTNGKQCAKSPSWPGSGITQYSIDMWMFLPAGAANMPIPTSAGGSGALDMYTLAATAWGASGTAWEMKISPSGNRARLNFSAYYSSGNKNTVYYTIWDAGTNPPINRTGQWLHVIVNNKYVAASTDPNQKKLEMTIYSSTDVNGVPTTTSFSPISAVYNVSGKPVWLGMYKNSADNGAYRGFRGKMDDVKIRTRISEPIKAYGANPVNNASVQPNANLPLSWIKATPVNPAQPIKQNVYFGTTSTFGTSAVPILTNFMGTSTTVNATTLDVPLYWCVDSNDPNTKVVTRSTIWKFTPTDIPPTVTLGADVATYLTNGSVTQLLTGTVGDIDSPTPSLTWAQIAGPSAATVTPVAALPYRNPLDPAQTTTANVTITQPGAYFFQLTATSGAKSTSAVQMVRVLSSACAVAQAGTGFTWLANDINHDCVVSFADIAMMAANWLTSNSYVP
jgi:hypothetical protein